MVTLKTLVFLKRDQNLLLYKQTKLEGYKTDKFYNLISRTRTLRPVREITDRNDDVTISGQPVS